MTTAAQPLTVAILLCTYNGARFLEAQLASLKAQTHPAWTLWAADDGSSDETRAVLQRAQSDWGQPRVHILEGPRAGSSANFLSLVCNESIQADAFAYCDQDDIWHEDKLARASAWLSQVPKSTPALYFSRTQLIDAAGNDLGPSRLFTRPPGFRNALVQNIGGGNTMVFNAAARDILRAAGPQVPVVVHDWWTYMAVTGCGGLAHFDPVPTLKYRQHGDNQIGSNRGLGARASRAGRLLEGRFKGWTDINLAALETVKARLTPENRRVLEVFTAARQQPLIGRLIGLARSGITRQTFIDNVGLYLAAAMNRL
ncbi:MAG: glycosyltransferase family 2 protein [Rhodospirillaceae bacterium]|nr:glycosyltransferase family 2 protein [Rhodospirillaceae bacterium]